MPLYTFNQLCSMVYTETNRPDLIAETAQAVFEATLTAHCSDFYVRDITSVQTTFDVADYIQTLDISTIPYFRAINSFRKAVPGPTLYQPMSGSISDPLVGDPVTGSYSYPLNEYVFLEELSPDDLLDDYGYEKVDVFYQAGTIINIKSSSPIINGQFQYYSFPEVDIANSGAGYSSWIANNYPFLIVYGAAASVFAKIGQDVSSKLYADPSIGKYMQQFALFRMSNISATGK